jgi:hypothetical protein
MGLFASRSDLNPRFSLIWVFFWLEIEGEKSEFLILFLAATFSPTWSSFWNSPSRSHPPLLVSPSREQFLAAAPADPIHSTAHGNFLEAIVAVSPVHASSSSLLPLQPLLGASLTGAPCAPPPAARRHLLPSPWQLLLDPSLREPSPATR